MPSTATPPIEGQLNAAERALLMDAVKQASPRPQAIIEVGTWLGGGSTIHLLRALEHNGEGRLWGIEAERTIHDRMIANLRAAAPECVHRFTPLFGSSQAVLPQLLSTAGPDFKVDMAFLDGGNNPSEQMEEFRLLAPCIRVGGVLFAHDAKLRKGKWLVPFLSALDNWECQLHDISDEGLFEARKLGDEPTQTSLAAARRRLRRQRLEPKEIAAAVLPRPLCALILRLLPERMVRRIADGRG
ncbi:MAG: class I SAM-dependent methyltransferase [Verrucomicrobia bacterium]|nr:class I SAM-dependent methyltransferase [Verrucomicrobiota bacterium]